MLTGSGHQQGDYAALIHVADVVGTHGLRGDLKVRCHSGDPDVLLALAEIALETPGHGLVVAQVIRQTPHKGVVLLRLKGYEAIALAEPLVGSKVKIPESALPELDEDEYYWDELVGLQVIDRHYGDLGRLVRMFTTAAHDTYVVEGGYGEVLIPAVKEFIVEIDLKQNSIEVDLPAGLVPEPE
ncbi:ribosome maturation factor RimM [Pelovirga terrestris]|uniref:Ribosome maturation factor RimM n=1 Tax=Pelovirga terrestris TaxID=2771352 RepID=A0A8J6QWR1_9BACT|nr:ribosome maturation factor RimM [Pelovirga terrestris]MBD1400161.1 16S rRNA processing protein RimM [Pelovirga terrestris]